MKVIEQILSVYGVGACLYGGLLLGVGLENDLLHNVKNMLIVGGIFAFGVFSMIYVIISLEGRLLKAEKELKDRNNN